MIHISPSLHTISSNIEERIRYASCASSSSPAATLTPVSLRRTWLNLQSASQTQVTGTSCMPTPDLWPRWHKILALIRGIGHNALQTQMSL